MAKAARRTCDAVHGLRGACPISTAPGWSHGHQALRGQRDGSELSPLPMAGAPAPLPACPALPPGLMLKVLWMELRRMQVTVLVTACMWEKSCMAHSGKAGAEPF